MDGSLEVLEWLVSEGASGHACTNEGSTPMFLACRGGHTEVAKYLRAKLACARLVDPGESASAAPRTVLSEVLERRHQHLHESVAADLADHFHFVPRLPNVHVSPVERGREEMRRQMKNRV